MIKQISITNYKNIEKMDLALVKGVYLISGENNLGKSHLIEALILVLTGDRSADILTKGKQSGQVEATIEVNGKEYSIRLAYSEANPRGTLAIKGEGVNTDNKSFLQSICQYTDFDAGEFVQWSETAAGRRKQIESLKALLPIEVQTRILELDAEIAMTREQRRAANVSLKDTRTLVSAALTACTGIDVPAVLKHGPFERKQVSEELQTCYDKRRDLREVSARLEKNRGLVNTFDHDTRASLAIGEQTAKELHDELDEIRRMLAAKEAQITAHEIKTTEYKDARKKEKVTINGAIKTDLAFVETKGPGITSRISELEHLAAKGEAIDADHTAAATYDNLVKRKDREVKAQLDVTSAFDKLVVERGNLIKSANLPVADLTFDDDQMYLNGLPYNKDVVSTSDMIQVACSLQIAANKKTGVFKVMNGESLGREKMAAILKFGKANGLQGFVEEVRRDQDELTIKLIENFKV